MADTAQKSLSRRLSVVSTTSSTSTLSGRNRTHQGNSSNNASVTNDSSTQPSSHSHLSSRTKPSRRQLSDEQNDDRTDSSRISQKEYRAMTENVLKIFKDLEMVEHKLADQTSQVLAKMEKSFTSQSVSLRESESDDEDLQSKIGYLGNDKSRSINSTKRVPSNPTTPIKPSITRRTSQEAVKSPVISSSITHWPISHESRKRTNTLTDGKQIGHIKYASDNIDLTTNGPVEPTDNKKYLKESRSDEKLKNKKKDKRKTLDVSLQIKTSAMEQLEKFASMERVRRGSTINTPLSSKSKNSNDYSVSDDDYNPIHGRTPSPLLPTVSKSKTMPITPPLSALTSRLPPPTPIRSVSYNSTSSLSKNTQSLKKSESDNNLTVTSDNMKKRKSTTSGSMNSSNTSPPKPINSRTTTPTSGKRDSLPPPISDSQIPPPVPAMPSYLPKLTKDSLKAHEDIPPVPTLPSSITNEKKLTILTDSKGGNISPREKKDKIADTKKKTRSRGAITGQPQTDRIVRRQTLPANMAAPAQLAALTLPPFNVTALPPNVKIPTHSNPNLKSKTPTAPFRVLTTPTSKIPTPTLVPSKPAKLGSGLSSPNGKGIMSSSKVAPASPNGTSSKHSRSQINNGTAINGSTTSSKSDKKPTRTTPKRRLSTAISNMFSGNKNGSSSSTAKTPTNIPSTTGRKHRTTSHSASANSSTTNLPNSSLLIPSYGVDVDSSSSAASTPSGYNNSTQYDDDNTTSGEDETTCFIPESEKNKKERERERKKQDARTKGSLAMNPHVALKTYAPSLSLYERSEILDYPEVYFVGQHAQKVPSSPELSGCNFGFDDERGDYNVINNDHLCYRYEIVESLGKGSFGQVLKCLDHKTGEYVAVKIIRNKKRFHCQALVEVKILECLNRWDPDDSHNIVHMDDHFYFRNHLCIVFELLSMNLYEFIKSHDFQGFSLGLIKRFCVQLLNSLSLLQKHNIVHCDLKPENVLLKHPTKSSIKVIDFGSSCFENEKVYTYIQSRFYRSPEVILGMTYNMAIDMWSLGCILAELYTGYPLFPGEGEQEQLACIMEIQGIPERYLIEKSTRKKLFFDTNGNPRPVVNSKGKRRRPGTKTLQNVLKCQDEVFLDFISRCLHWDPEKRMKPDEGLMHEWITDVKLSTRNYLTNYDLMRRQSPTSSSHPSSSSSLSMRQVNTSSSRGALSSQQISHSTHKTSSTSNQNHLVPGHPPTRRSLDAQIRSNGTRHQYVTSIPMSLSARSGKS